MTTAAPLPVSPVRRPLRTTRTLQILAGLMAVAMVPATASAQISLATVLDLALRNSPRVKGAESDTARALAVLQETHDVYIPSLNGGAGLGEAYGYSPNPPTLFTFNAQSLIYNYAQFSYIRSARIGLSASKLALQDVQEAVAEDTALTYIGLNHDLQRQQVLTEEMQYADRLVSISQQRLDLGVDRRVDLTTAKLQAAQLNLSVMKAEDDVANDRDHLAQLTGIPAASLSVEPGFPVPPPIEERVSAAGDVEPAGVTAAFANAAARQQGAVGDSHFLYRPQISLVIQYNRYASFTNSFQQLQNLYDHFNTTIGANEEVFGVQITVPFFDKYRQAKARESLAEAAKLYHDAQGSKLQSEDAQHRLRHSIRELRARAQVADLDQQLAEQQLETTLLQVNNRDGDAPPLTPKEEQNSRIGERQKYLALLDARQQLLTTEVNLLRQTGGLMTWLRSAPMEAAIRVQPSEERRGTPAPEPAGGVPAPAPRP